MKQWNDIHEVRIPSDSPVVVKQCNGVTNFGCHHATPHSSGIIKLNRDNDNFKWDGQTYLLKVTHWRDIAPEDLIGAADLQQPTAALQNSSVE